MEMKLSEVIARLHELDEIESALESTIKTNKSGSESDRKITAEYIGKQLKKIQSKKAEFIDNSMVVCDIDTGDLFEHTDKSDDNKENVG